ncbi:hypothetical protein AWQ21_13520 [Picosynechococcus sp. PCC 7003]|uniref:hypothetical protein n=1 Tax=Picosynechococcus sp. PCC 7003 TaxID=374981 RepID=UPI0008108D2D|nr:hypothetical protein [Picosynechococcus sp. PCC 7003]ANV85296.1 hypothetical protein AWQ21_13520 [Picosynechococcus sp. PCC 7003]
MTPPKIALLASFCCLGLAPLAVATLPQASQIVSVRGNYLMVQRGNQRPNFARVGDRLENRSQTLLVPGNNYSLARLSFIGGGQNYAGLAVQAGPDLQQTHYQFPCVVSRGKVTLSWRQGNNRGCEEGIYLSPNRNNNKGLKQTEKEKASTKGMEGIVIQPKDSNEVILQARTLGDRQIVDALVGEITLTSAAHPSGFTLQPGQRYSLDGNNPSASPQVEPINAAAILNSPELQEFLDPSSWMMTDDAIAKTPDVPLPIRPPVRQPSSGETFNPENGGFCDNYFSALQNFLQEAQSIVPGVWDFANNPYALLTQPETNWFNEGTLPDEPQLNRLRQRATDFINEFERCQFALPNLPTDTEPENSPNDLPPENPDSDLSPEIYPDTSPYQ